MSSVSKSLPIQTLRPHGMRISPIIWPPVEYPHIGLALIRKSFLKMYDIFFLEDPYMFKYCPDQVVRQCVPDDEVKNIVEFCHSQACGGHFSSQ